MIRFVFQKDYLGGDKKGDWSCGKRVEEASLKQSGGDQLGNDC